MVYMISGLAVYMIAAVLIAHYIGREHRIGFTRSLIFSLVNPILGYVITIQSGKKRNRFNPFQGKSEVNG